jgi:hypothetical protein
MVRRLAVGLIAGQPSFFSAKTKPCLGRARKAIMQRALMATLDSSEPSSLSLFER